MNLLWLILVVPPSYILNWGQKRFGYYSKVEQYPLFMVFHRILDQLTQIFGQKRVGYYSKMEQHQLFMLFLRILNQLNTILGKKRGWILFQYLDTIPLWNYIYMQTNKQKKHADIIIYLYIIMLRFLFVCLFLFAYR